MSSNDISLKKFITEDEIEDKRRRRQEEWEKTRTPDQPLECPEEDTDTRSLYDRLAEQKQKKEDEFEEQHRLSNQVKGLEEEEVAFLDHVSQRHQELERERQGEERVILQQMQDSTIIVSDTRKCSGSKPRPSHATSNNKSQNALLAGAVKRKTADGTSGEKRSRLSSEGESTHQHESTAAETRDMATSGKFRSQNSDLDNASADTVTTNIPVVIRPPAHVAIGVLPGIGCYGNDTTDTSNSDSSDMEETTQTQNPCVRRKQADHIDHVE